MTHLDIVPWPMSQLYPESRTETQAEMSGFSTELIDYLEGKITFEEFDRRRDERKIKVRLVTLTCHIAIRDW